MCAARDLAFESLLTLWRSRLSTMEAEREHLRRAHSTVALTQIASRIDMLRTNIAEVDRLLA